MFFLAIPKKRSVCLSACQLFLKKPCMYVFDRTMHMNGLHICFFYVFSNYSWEDADRICRSLDMSIPLQKTIQDVESVGKGYASEKKECGFMTFLAMRRNHKVITVYLKK